MRKTLAHDTRMQKNQQTMTNVFWIFMEFYGGSKAQLAPPRGNFINDVAKPEIAYSAKMKTSE